MPTLRGLCRALGDDLVPEGELPPEDVEVSGVHVSELADPTPYLSGGELLLTTGMALTGHRAQARAYAARLKRLGVAGLGLGLGPIHDAVPPSISSACEATGLPLLVVPAPTPFLVVARAYWTQLAEAGQAELNASLGAQRDLVRAATQRDPVSAVVRTLASAVEGWAARLSPDGEVLEVWPRSRRSTARQVRHEIERMRGAGPHSSATFPLGGEDVVVQPLSRASRLIGFVATGCPRPMRRPDRQLVLAACSLLTLQLDQRHQALSRARVQRACMLRLALAGHPEAARALAGSLGVAGLPERCRLLGVALPSALAAEDLLDRWDREAPRQELWMVEDEDAVWVVCPTARAGELLQDLGTMLRGPAAGARAVVGPPCRPSALTRQRLVLGADLARALPDQLPPTERPSSAERALQQLQALGDYNRSDLLGAVAAYLRHRGHWEEAAAALGVHRNTLRHRISTASHVLGADLDEPDTASHLWLAMRAAGVA